MRFNLMEVHDEIAEAPLLDLESLAVCQIRRHVAATELLELFDDDLALRFSHNFGHGRVQVDEPLAAELLELAQLAQLHGHLGEHVVVNEQLLEVVELPELVRQPAYLIIVNEQCV